MKQSDVAALVAAGQPERPLVIGFRVPAGWRADTLDTWLRDVLCTDPQSGSRIEPEAAQVPDAQHVFPYLTRILAMAGELLRASRLPAFQPIRVLALTPPDAPGAAGTSNWRARVALPLLDGVTKRFAAEVIKQALRETERLSDTPITPREVEAFSRRVEESLVQPFAWIWGRGKSTMHLLRGAHRLGVPFFHLGSGLFQIGPGPKARRVDRSAVDGDSAFGARASHDKASTAELLRLAGLPAPRHGVVDGIEPALQVARSLGWPVVVKPADRDRGEGVQVDITNEADLRTAVQAARELSRARRVIVERQVPGVCHRLFIASGRLLYAVARHPMSVTGDGVATIRQLVDAMAVREARLASWHREPVPMLDPSALAELEAADLGEGSVPAAGQRVRLRRIESTAAGGVDEDVSARVHPENLRAAISASRLFGLEVAGIDIICPDISIPWNESGAIINEVNFAPLLGGGDISRAKIPEFIQRLLGGDGRIPVELFVGAEAAWTEARKRQDAMRASGLRAWAVRDRQVLDEEGAPMPMDLPAGAFPRARALALRRDVDALVIAASPSEALLGRWPIECLDRVTTVAEVGVV